MKLKISVLTILLVTYTLAKAQPYQSIFYSDTTKWTVSDYIPDLHATTQFSTYSDTLIDGINYKILYEARGCEPDYKYDKSYLKEDTLTGKVWNIIDDENSWHEILIMDLSLELKDTFLFSTNFYFNKADTLVVDTIYYDEEGRKVIGLVGEYYYWDSRKLLFIEGIGSSYGFCPLFISPTSMGLRCKFDNSEHIYTLLTDYEDDCYFYCGDSSGETELSPFYKITQVSSGQVNIFINDAHKNVCLDIFNIQGLFVKSQQLSAGDNSIHLKLDGVFIFRLNDGGNTVSVKISL